MNICLHCHETELDPQCRYLDGLCKSCRNYQYRTGQLPTDDVLSKRFGWAPYDTKEDIK